jgi:photosystem II stability/assembly factor-like uncharacterized protein
MIRNFVFILIIELYFTFNSFAQWQECNNGLNGGDIRTICIDGINIFAGTDEGVYLSTDNGNSWKLKNMGLEFLFVNSFAIIGDTILAGTNIGMFYSTDYGNHWVKNENYFDYIYSIVVSGDYILAGSDFGEVYMSTDNGKNWAQKNLGNESVYVTSLAVFGKKNFCRNKQWRNIFFKR